MEEMTVYNREMVIFVDETGSDRRDSIRKYGYSLRGQPARTQKLLVRGRRVSAIGVLSVSSMLDCYIVEGTVDANKNLLRHHFFLIYVHLMEQIPIVLWCWIIAVYTMLSLLKVQVLWLYSCRHTALIITLSKRLLPK